MIERFYVLDTSAWLALIEDEAGADTVQQLLEQAATGSVLVMTSFVGYMEVYYITCQERGEDEARVRLALMDSLAVLRVESNHQLGVAAARIKALRRVSFADAWIAALALETDATLVHKDPEYDQIPELQKVLRLPLKSGSGHPDPTAGA